jgi:hypothetical protein
MKGIYDAFNTYDEMKPHIEKTDLSTDRFAAFKLSTHYRANVSANLEEAKKRNQESRLRII